MSWQSLTDILTGACLVAGAALSLSGSIGLLRFPDVLARMHATTKPQVLGLVLMLAAVGLQVPSWGTVTTLLLVALFQLATAPISAHMIGRAAYRTRRLRKDRFTRDELAEAVERASARNVGDGRQQ